MKRFHFALPRSLIQDFKFGNSLKWKKKFIKAFQVLGSKVISEKISWKSCCNIASDASIDAKLIENHMNNFFAQISTSNNTLKLYLEIAIIVFENFLQT